MTELRSPICAVLGHVDHGKTLLLDKIRGSAIQSGEAGGITQAIGASIIPMGTIKDICGELIKQIKSDVSIPGLLFIDTPGHEAFTSLRKRGGNLADIAIVVIDINEGFKPQTHETIQILKQSKTPFIIAANKLDLIPGWQQKQGSLLKKIKSQYPEVQQKIDMKIYEIVGKLNDYGFVSERFDRVENYTKQIGIIPVSAKTGEGIPELLMVLTGLAQRFLDQCLQCHVEGPAKGTVLEVKEVTGLGTTLDAIIYDGTLNVDDYIVIGSLDGPITTKVRALLIPTPLAEMRDKKAKFKHVEKVTAATGVKISAPDLEEVSAGMPILESTEENLKKVQEQVEKEVQDILIETDTDGIIIKADTLGSLEAITSLLGKEDVSIRKASIGTITKKDIMDANANEEMDKKVILGFNTEPNQEAQELAKELGVCILTDTIIYKMIQTYKAWHNEILGEKRKCQLIGLTRPCKIRLLPGYVFRQRSPAISGADVLAGILRTGIQLMKKNEPLTTVKSIQQEKKNLQEVEAGNQIAISLDRITIGRQVEEGDVLFSYIPEDDFRKLKNLKDLISKEEIAILREIADMMREKNPFWGI